MRFLSAGCIWFGVIVLVLSINPSFSQQEGSVNYYSDSRNQIGLPTDQATLLRGKQLFQAHCGSCHSLCRQRMGPPLAGVTDRRPMAWLFDFINSSQRVIQNGDPYARFLYDQYNHAIMPDFKFLSQEKVLAILGYINAASSSPTHVSGVNSAPLRDIRDPIQPMELPMQSTVTGIEYEEEGVTGTKYLILKVVIFVVAALSAVAHILFVMRLWRKGKTKFKI